MACGEWKACFIHKEQSYIDTKNGREESTETVTAYVELDAWTNKL